MRLEEETCGTGRSRLHGMKQLGAPTRLAAGLSLSAVIATLGGCSGEAASGPPAGGATTPVTLALRAVTLPAEPGPLVDVIARQVRAARTVHVQQVSTGSENGRRVREKVSAQLRTDVQPPSAQLVIVDGGPEASTTEAVLDKGVIYTRADGEQMEPGKPWVRLSRQDLAANPELGPFIKIFTSIIDEVDKALREVSSDTGLALVRNGSFTAPPAPENLAGTQARRYAGKTPTAAMAAADKTFAAMEKGGLKEIGWTLWVDGRGLPLRFTAAFRTPGGTEVLNTVDYRQWGQPVLIQIPPAAQVATLAD